VPDKENAQRFTGTKKCGGTKTHKGACAFVGFCGTRTAEQAVSSYRLLDEVWAYTIFTFLILFSLYMP